MALQNLNLLAQKLQNHFKTGFVSDDTELPESFKNHVKNLGEYSFSYKKHMVHMESTTLDGYIPNVWFIIASYFVEYYNEIVKYKELLVKTLRELGVSNSDRDTLLGKFPKLTDSKYKALPLSERNATKYKLCQNEASEEISKEVTEILDKSSLLADDKLFLIKFVSDYNWWHGGKTIDRGDFYVSPILTLANVVNASHSFIADLCKFLSNEEIAAAYLRHPNAVVIEKNLPSFFYNVFRFIYNKEDGLEKILEHLEPGSAGSIRYDYSYNGLKQTNFFVKGESQFLTNRNGDFNPNPFLYRGEKYYLSQELAKERVGKNEVSYVGLKPVIENNYPNYELLDDSGCYILIQKKMSIRIDSPLQQIYYGAPGTGKSHTINAKTEGESVIRTTFHPDSDYSTFVGAYKPTMGLLPICDELGQPMKIGSTVLHKEQIIYEFVDQAFLQAYVQAWKNIVFYEGKKQYLVIEEINRGNCAQIFGDLFQLLDRNVAGFSDYPINADKDMQKFLKKAFARTDEPDKQIFLQDADKQRINQLYKGGEDIVSKVFAGEILVLPNNFYIWATMNTSDQSLFPIDSAFKRRWEWQYVPIGKGFDENCREIKWSIEGATKKYDWWSFLEKINAQVGEATQSEDKKLGFFFCKANNGIISAEKFVGKVIFYLWNDVFKNNGFEGPIFKDVDGTELSFGKFYKSDMKGNAIVQKDKVELFLTNLGVEVVEEDYDEEYEDEGARVSDTNAPYRVTFPDGEIICEGSGWETYVASLQKIGLEKALPFGEMYSRLNKTLPLITKKKIADQGVYKYYEVDGYYVLSGTDSQHRLLKRMNKDLNLGLTIE